MILLSVLLSLLQEGDFQAAEKRYTDCLSKIERSPDTAIDMALAWAAEGGSMPARHCEALALIAYQEYKEAAARLTQMAEDIERTKGLPRKEGKALAATPFLAGDMWQQAATAWVLANEMTRAADAIDRAVALALDGGSRLAKYLIDRARISALVGDHAAAYDDLMRVEEADPARRDILVFIASAARSLGYYQEADQALKDFLAGYPDDPAGYLELGNLRAEQDRMSAAQKAWLKVLELEDQGPNADAARQNLQDIALNGQ